MACDRSDITTCRRRRAIRRSPRIRSERRRARWTAFRWRSCRRGRRAPKLSSTGPSSRSLMFCAGTARRIFVDQAGHVGRSERRVMNAITACRTAALGGHVEACDDCGATRHAFNSCRDRHCPKCQGAARARWLADRQAELLPVPYFHVVFTLPRRSPPSPSRTRPSSTRYCSGAPSRP